MCELWCAKDGLGLQQQQNRLITETWDKQLLSYIIIVPIKHCRVYYNIILIKHQSNSISLLVKASDNSES